MTADLGSKSRKARLFRAMFGLRALVALVLVIGGGLGWIVHAARVQREAVATVKRLEGNCRYEWEAQIRRPAPGAIPAWRKWLIDILGPDYTGSVTQAQVGLGFSGPGATPEDLAKIGRLARLEYLSVFFATSARQGFTQLRNFSRLKHLDLIETDGKAGDGDLAALANLSELEELQLTLPWVSDSDLAHIAGLTRLKSLTVGTPVNTVPGANPLVTDAGLAHLESLHDLQFLHLSGDNAITNAGLAHLAGLTRLESLTIQGAKVTSLEPLRPLVGLKYLSVAGTAIDDAGAAPIAGFLRLETLGIAGKSFTNAGLAHLRALPRLANLDIRGTAVDDVGVASLAEFPSLKGIFLGSTSVTDAGLAVLAKKPGYAVIDLAYTQVSPGAVAAARSSLPGTTIIAPNNHVPKGTGFGSMSVFAN